MTIQKNAVKIFLYSDEKSKEKRVTKYYKIPAEKVQKQITKINKERAKHYKFYTNRNWQSIDNYDIMLNVDKYGVEQTAKNIEELLREESNQ